jgi:hypothetical protein
MKLLGSIGVGFDVTDQVLIITRYWRKKWEYSETVHQLSIGFKIRLGQRLINMCLNETYSRVHSGKHLSDNFPIQNGLKQDASVPLLLNCTLEYAIRTVQENRVELKLNGTHLAYADNVNLLGVNINTSLMKHRNFN